METLCLAIFMKVPVEHKPTTNLLLKLNFILQTYFNEFCFAKF